MRQRVAIARALVYKPSLLLMDEPFGALDAQTRGTDAGIAAEGVDEHKVTVLFVTHDVEEAIFLADRVVVLASRPGRLKRIVPVSLGRPRRYRRGDEPGVFRSEAADPCRYPRRDPEGHGARRHMRETEDRPIPSPSTS